MKKALIIFTKEPKPGFTKTRLMPYLSGEECARLHKKFLRKIRDSLTHTKSYDCFVCYAKAEGYDELKNIFKEDVFYFPQDGDNLGKKMENAFLFLFEKGYDKIILIGSDTPQIKKADIDESFLSLDTTEIVLGPTEDGGYYLVGMNSFSPEIFGIEAYSHEGVFSDTVDIIKKLGFSYGLIKKYYDIDTPEDLKRYKRECNEKISIIIPVYNEEKIIEKTKKRLEFFTNKCEIIFVDGGSTDNTFSMIKDDFKAISSKKGRGNQLNQGAKVAKGEILLFLHADCELPINAIEEIHQVVAENEAGYFGIKYKKEDGVIMRLGAFISNLRARLGKIVFGDQGIFIDKELFLEMGGFKDIQIMEDYEFSKRLKTNGIKIGKTEHEIIADSRRFTKNPIKKIGIGIKMYYLRFLFDIGVSPERIARIYR